MAKFSFADMLSKKTAQKSSQEKEPEKESFRIELISVYKLQPSKDNFYSMANIEDLKDSIEMLGVQQNLTVKPILGTDKYTVISGHRRRLASLQLVEEGKPEFEHIPCRVETDIDEIREKIILIHTNSTARKLTKQEELEQLTQLKALIAEYKKNHKIPGRVRELLAETLNMSVSQVERLETIDNKLLPELKEEFKQDKINFSTASELARLSLAEQAKVYETHKETGTTTINQAGEKKESIQPVEQNPKENPKLRALLIIKTVLHKEAERGKLTGITDLEVINEYRIFMNKKAQEVEKEIKKLMGQDMFNNTGAEG